MKKILLLLVVSAGLLLTSCYKEPENGTAKITVYHNAFRQPGVDVHLYGPSGSFIDHHFLTDMNGEVIYEHDPALEVILNVHATYTDISGFHEAYGIVRIKPDHQVDESFTLYP